jgi:L-amino acid N-acyltransferase YncA
MAVEPETSHGGRARAASAEIVESTEDDLPGIVDILNYTAANSIATFDTRPVSVADRGDWFGVAAIVGIATRPVTGAEELRSWTARLCLWRSLPAAQRRN